MSNYEIWLTDDGGNRLTVLKDLAYFSYTRVVNGLGTLQLGLPVSRLGSLPLFYPDWRVEVWRRPDDRNPMRREDVFLLRKYNLYEREDGVKLVRWYGRNGVDLLKRRSVIQPAGSSGAAKTGALDNLMKQFVREQSLYGSCLDKTGAASNTRAYPQNEWQVQGDSSAGPSLTRDFAGRTLFDICKELSAVSQQKNAESASNNKIYYDVEPLDIPGTSPNFSAPVGWIFRTYPSLRGSDRTQALEFSRENGILANPSFDWDQLDEVTSVEVTGAGNGGSQPAEIVTDASGRATASRWNLVEKVINASSATTTTDLQSAGLAELGNGLPKKKFDATLLNIPQNPQGPQSLYGVQWDLGDLVRCQFGGLYFNMEIKAIYVSVDEQGVEQITGRSDVQ